MISPGISFSTGRKAATGGRSSASAAHTHSTSLNYYQSYNDVGGMSPYGCSGKVHGTGHLTSSSTGGGKAHENRPPYYALYYIMRIN